MKGYKVLDKGLINQYGFKYELGKTYDLKGELDYKTNGFCFCSNPETTLMFAGDKNNFDLTEVEALGKIVSGDDYFENRYYDINGLYATDKMIIKRLVPREELVSMVIESNNVDRLRFLNMYLKFTDEEISKILEKYGNDMKAYIEYYQYGDKEAFNREYERKRTI